MKILFVLENYMPHIGGVEVVFRNLAEGLAKKGHDCIVLTHRLKGTKKFEKINGVKVKRIDCFHSRYWFSFLSIFEAVRLAKKCDIIHTTTYNGALPAKIASIFSKKRCVITVHEILGRYWEDLDLGWLNAKIHRFLENMIIKLNFDKYVCVSKSTARQVLKQGISKDKIKVVYNGVDYEHWNPKKYNKKDLGKGFKYLFYGRPGITKGFEYLLKAVPLIKNGRLIAILSKDKAYDKRYNLMMDLIKKLKIKDKIKILDPVPYKELPKYIKAVDCVVVPSLTEGFGFTAAESCAMDKPVIASNTTSLPEVVSGKFILIEPRDPEVIAGAVVNVQNKRFNKSKKKYFRLEDNIRNYLKVYNSK